jgi:hypothetical protein
MGGQIPGTISPLRLNLVQWHPLSVGPPCGTCFMSPFWRPEFEASPKFLERLCTPAYLYGREMSVVTSRGLFESRVIALVWLMLLECLTALVNVGSVLIGQMYQSMSVKRSTCFITKPNLVRCDQPRGLMVRVSDYWSWGLWFDSRFYHGDFSLKRKIPMVTMVWVV